VIVLRLVVPTLVAVLAGAVANAADATDDPSTHAAAHGNSFYLDASSAESQTSDTPVTTMADDIQGHWSQETVCDMGGAQVCADVMLCDDGSVMTHSWLEAPDGSILDSYYQCPQQASVAAPPQVTEGLVLQAFRRIPLPASKLQVQPPGGETLVNFETNFFTEQEPFTRTVRLLGQRVELKIWPSQFRWVFGDGNELASAEPGAPYPALEITHDYARKGGVSPRVDTTYAAQFRVNGGAWRDVNGTVTIPGAPVQLQVRTATPVLVGYR
jgi:hypothetical protein